MLSPRPTVAGLALSGALAAGSIFSGAPALAAAPEEPVTKAASAITGTTATLNGELNPKVSAKTGFDFTYNTNGECTGGVTTTQGAEATGKAIKVSTPLTGLIPSTEYTFCVVATRLTGEVTESTPGLPLSFKTLGHKPVVVAESSSSVTPFAETLEVDIDPENQATTSCTFEYGLTSAYGSTAECEPPTFEGSEEQHASTSLTGLKSATTYHFHVVVTNPTGATKGADGEFTTSTAEEPIIGSEGFSELTSTDAKLKATINPNFQETAYAFEYATNEALTDATTVPGAPPAPLLPAVFEEQLAGPVDLGGALQPGVVYYYRVVAQNEAGEAKGGIQSFQTLALPTVTAGEAQGVSRTTAALSGTVNPAGASTTYHFAYIERPGYEAAVAEKAENPYAKGATTPQSASVGSDRAAHEVGPVQVNELRPGVTYDYALVATNSVGTTIGPNMAFTTLPPTPPIVATGAAVEIGQTTAVVLGALDTRGLPTSYRFELGPAANSYFPQAFAGAALPAGAQAVSLQLSYLAPGATYHYRLCATNPDGTICGADGTFATPGVPNPLILPATPPLLVTAVASAPSVGVKGTTTRALTKAQKLANAVKACRKKPKRQRARCEKQARKKYGTAKRAAKGKKK